MGISNAISSFTQVLSNTLNFYNKKPNNAEMVSRAKQYGGERPRDLPFLYYYQYYHQNGQVGRNLNSIHKRWMGSKIEVRSKSPEFDALWNIWANLTDFIPKLKEFALDTLITGTGLMERQYFRDNFGNIEHIPTKTLYVIYRDGQANVLSIWQQNEGDLIQLSPDHVAIFTINNPERDAIGKSAMYALAVPQMVAGATNELGNPINPERYLPSILDTKARLNFAHMEVAEKQAKSQHFVSLKNVKDKDRQQQIEKRLESAASSQYVTVTDSEVDVKSLVFPNQVANQKYLEDIDTQINQGTGFPGNVIDETQSGFASSQTPLQDTAMLIDDMQDDLARFVKREIFKHLCETWGIDYLTAEPELVFSQYVEKINFEQTVNLLKVPDVPLTDIERRDLLKEFVPGMGNDEDYEKWKEEKEDKAKEIQQTSTQQTDESRPDVEKEAPEPDTTTSKEAQAYFALPPLNGMKVDMPNPEITNPDTLEQIKQLFDDIKNGQISNDDAMQKMKDISKESDAVGKWIEELTDKHPDWKRDQVIAVAIKKSKEYKACEVGTPHDFEPFDKQPLLCKWCANAADDIIHQVEKIRRPRQKK